MHPSSRHIGLVKFFDPDKGYGFILSQDEQATDVFVHYTANQDQRRFKYLVRGEEVEYDLIHGPKGWYAGKVTGAGARINTSYPYMTHPQGPMIHSHLPPTLIYYHYSTLVHHPPFYYYSPHC